MKATVNQFNAVSLRVISTILTCSESKTSGPNTRGKYIARWINVAQVRLRGDKYSRGVFCDLFYCSLDQGFYLDFELDVLLSKPVHSKQERKF